MAVLEHNVYITRNVWSMSVSVPHLERQYRGGKNYSASLKAFKDSKSSLKKSTNSLDGRDHSGIGSSMRTSINISTSLLRISSCGEPSVSYTCSQETSKLRSLHD